MNWLAFHLITRRPVDSSASRPQHAFIGSKWIRRPRRRLSAAVVVQRLGAGGSPEWQSLQPTTASTWRFQARRGSGPCPRDSAEGRDARPIMTLESYSPASATPRVRIDSIAICGHGSRSGLCRRYPSHR